MQEVKSSVIMQKGESQNGCYKKTKHIKFSENEHFLPPDTHTCNLLKWNLGVKWVRLVCIKTFCFRIKLRILCLGNPAKTNVTQSFPINLKMIKFGRVNCSFRQAYLYKFSTNNLGWQHLTSARNWGFC